MLPDRSGFLATQRRRRSSNTVWSAAIPIALFIGHPNEWHALRCAAVARAFVASALCAAQCDALHGALHGALIWANEPPLLPRDPASPYPSLPLIPTILHNLSAEVRKSCSAHDVIPDIDLCTYLPLSRSHSPLLAFVELLAWMPQPLIPYPNAFDAIFAALGALTSAVTSASEEHTKLRDELTQMQTQMQTQIEAARDEASEAKKQAVIAKQDVCARV